MTAYNQAQAAAIKSKARQILKAKQAVKTRKRQMFKPYVWQLELFDAGRENKQRLLMAANRVGKTLGAVFEVACHATGNYPDWWTGLRFKYPPNIWCCGVSGEQIRDVLQKELMGEMTGDNKMTGGMIAGDEVNYPIIRAPVTPRLCKDVKVKHVTGGESTISFKSYTQGPGPLMGSSVDFALVDEQPPDDAYGQILTRTMTGDKGQGGYLLVTCTPELGLTNMLKQWLDEIKPGQYFRNVTWDDAEHLTDEMKEQMLDAMPASERELRSKGLPVYGQGLVYDFAPEQYLIEPIEIPHYWLVCCAIDFGLAHPFAGIWIALNPDNDKMIVYDEYRESNQLPPTHAQAINARGCSIPVIYPHDGGSREKSTGRELVDAYRAVNVNIVAEFDNPDGSNAVSAGIVECKQRFKSDRLKIFKTCNKTQEEMRTYHFKDGKIVKKFDDLMDAMRYDVMSIGRYGIYKRDANNLYNHQPIVYEHLDI